jgi:hypothetical protein
LLLFAPATKGPWVQAVERELRKRRTAAQIVLVTERLEAPLVGRSRAWRWLFSRPASERAPATREVDRVVQRLRAVGAQVRLVERATGRLSTPLLPERRAS